VGVRLLARRPWVKYNETLDQPRGIMTDTPLLKVEHLSLVRNGQRILNDVNLTVNPGQVHALLGLNGSGKSSLAYALMGCAGYKPDSGRIVFRDQDITSMAIHERARLGLTLAWQEPARFEGLPVGKYIALGMAEFNRDQALAALEAVALPPRSYAVRPVNETLSGGERKRVELAAVYAMRPQLAILDEPDSGIDALSLDDIGILIRSMAQAGSAVLLISHRDEMVSVADSASIMCLGTIIYSGDPLTAHEYYRGRCAPHMASLGNQPWNKSLPEVRAALESDAGQAAGRPAEEGQS
jgi:Fe-S cluster assembly ATP-binding protein